MLARSFLIESSSKLLVTRTGIKAPTSLISGLWFPWPIYMSFEMRLGLGTLDSGERSLPFGLVLSPWIKIILKQAEQMQRHTEWLLFMQIYTKKIIKGPVNRNFCICSFWSFLWTKPLKDNRKFVGCVLKRILNQSKPFSLKKSAFNFFRFKICEKCNFSPKIKKWLLDWRFDSMAAKGLFLTKSEWNYPEVSIFDFTWSKFHTLKGDYKVLAVYCCV